VQDEQPRTVFVSGVEKCGMGNEVVDWSFLGYVGSSSVCVTHDPRTVMWWWMQNLE
jgi:hypothetical protein